MIPQSPPSCQVAPLQICLVGASGRMGQRIEEVCKRPSENAVIAIRPSRDGCDEGAPQPFDVIIDFSSREGTKRAAALALTAKRALLVGTTGLDEAAHAVLARISQEVAVLIAPNTSVGIAVMRALVADAASLLGHDFAVTITEVHHTKKLDKPSGTALALAKALGNGGAKQFDPEAIQSIRQGDVVGDHDVVFSSHDEIITLRHHAKNRDLFAVGAIRLARWIAMQPPGMYGLDDWFDEFRNTVN